MIKAISFDKLRDKVRVALQDRFGFDEMELIPWIAELFDEYVVAEMEPGVYFQIPYVFDEEMIELAERSEWIKVERQQIWVEAKRREIKSHKEDALCPKKAVKILDANARRIGTYATVWGERDCEDDRMTKQAIEPYLGKGAPFMFWIHGLDPFFGANPAGVWDTSSFKIDGTGLYVEGNVGRDDYGNEAWKRINDAGAYGLSVGSFWYLVKKEDRPDGTKDIIDWPLLDISLMEGSNKQCVPSAHERLSQPMEAALIKAADEYGIKMDHLEGGPIKNRKNQGDDKMPGKTQEPTVDASDIAGMVAKQVAAALEAEREAAERQSRHEAKIAEQVKTGVEEALVEKQAAFEEETASLREQLKAAEEKAKAVGQPQAPVVGSGQDTVAPFIKVFSPYDGLSTMDLALRYEMLKSYGKQPSNKYWRALAERAVELSRTEDTLYIKNGQPVKVPAVDRNALIPRHLDLEEVDGEVFSARAGKTNRFHSGGWVDSGSDVVTKLGIQQFVEIALKANELIYSTQASAGDEWVPTLMNAQLWRTVRLNAAVLGLFEQFDMPSQPYDYPIESTDPTFYKVGETTDESQLVLSGGPFSDSKVGTGKIAFSAGKLGGITYWSEEQEEDSIIATEPQLRDQYGLSVAHAIDEVLISGDETTGTGNISFDGSAIAAASRFLTIDGLRHQPIVTTTADGVSGGAITLDDFRDARSYMGTGGKFGVNPPDLAYIMDPGVWHKAYMLSEVLTLDAFGSAATVLTGQLGGLFGIPLIVSEDYGLTDANGKIHSTAGNNTKGSFLCVNGRGIKVGWRRRPRIRVVGLPGAEARYIVASARFDIGFKEAGMVAAKFNLTI